MSSPAQRGLGLLSTEVRLDGSELSAAQAENLSGIRVERSLGLPSRVTLTLRYPLDPRDSAGSGLGLVPKLGTHVAVVVDGHDLVDAEVTAVTLDHQVGGSTVQVVAHDFSHRLSGARTHKTWLEVTVADVVRILAGTVGLAASPMPGAGADKIPYLLQVEDDLSLLDTICARWGYDWWVTGLTLHLAALSDTLGTQVLNLGRDLDAFSVRLSRPPYSKAVVSSRTPGKAAGALSEQSVRPATLPGSDLLTHVGVKALPDTVAFSGTSGAETVKDADALARALIDTATARAVVARGRCSEVRVAPGCAIEVEGSGVTDGTYRVTSVEHIWRAGSGEWENRFTTGDRRPGGLLAGLAGGAAASASPSFQHSAMTTAAVTNLEDPEELGRVKVVFPHLSNGSAAHGQESAWARLVVLGAGEGRGSMTLPEVGDEVLVGFENGDLRQPVVLGGLYGDKAAVPADTTKLLGGKVAGRRITSRLGHIVELADGTAPAAQHVMLRVASGNTTVRVGEDKVEVVTKEGKPIQVTDGVATVELDGSGNISIKGQKVTIEAMQGLVLKGLEVKVTGTTSVALQTQGTAELKGTSVEVAAQTLCTIKGNAGVAIN